MLLQFRPVAVWNSSGELFIGQIALDGQYVIKGSSNPSDRVSCIVFHACSFLNSCIPLPVKGGTNAPSSLTFAQWSAQYLSPHCSRVRDVRKHCFGRYAVHTGLVPVMPTFKYTHILKHFNLNMWFLFLFFCHYAGKPAVICYRRFSTAQGKERRHCIGLLFATFKDLADIPGTAVAFCGTWRFLQGFGDLPSFLLSGSPRQLIHTFARLQIPKSSCEHG